jgi:hypothetical protein
LLAELSDGTEILRSNGQPAIFGVPKGALIDGVVPDHANVFDASERTPRCARSNVFGVPDGTLKRCIPW